MNIVHRAARARAAYLFVLPAYTTFAIFTLWPLLQSVLTSFQRVGIQRRDWIGIGNYERMLADEVFWRALVNTLLLSALIVPLVMICGLGIAVVAVRLSRRWQSLLRSAFYLPAVASAVVLSLVWLWILNPIYGLLNYLLGLVGFAPIAWLGQSETALLGILLVVFSFSLGGPVILFIAGLNSVPQELYEAARIDGASGWQEFSNIALPLIRPTSAFVMITTTIGTFQVFTVIQIMTRGGPANATQTIVYRIYEKAFLVSDFGYASALSVLLLGVAYAVALVQMRVVGREVQY